LSFENGTGFTDVISEDLPVSTIPNDIGYEDYLSYIYGYSVFDLGTVNVSGGAGTTILFGSFVGDYTIEPGDNVFTGIEGITEDGKKGSNLDVVRLDYNAFSDIQVSKETNEDSIWLRSNTNDLNQIDAYGSVDAAFQPIGQQALALQGEDGDINIQNKFVVKSSKTSSTRGKVGVGTTEPEKELHIVGNLKVNQVFGRYGNIIPLDFYEKITGEDGIGSVTIPKTGALTGGQGGFYNTESETGVGNAYIERVGKGYEINCYYSEFNTDQFNSTLDALIFLSWYGSSYKDSDNRGDLVQFKMYLYEGETFTSIMNYTEDGTTKDVPEPIAQSASVAFDHGAGATERDFMTFMNSELDPNTDYLVKLVISNVSGGALEYELRRISGSVFAVPQ